MKSKQNAFPDVAADFTVHLPKDMQERVEQAAAKNKRSIEAEVEAQLEAAFPVPEEPTPKYDELHHMMQYLNGAKTDEQLSSRLSSINEELDSTGERIRLSVSEAPMSESSQPGNDDSEEPRQVILQAAETTNPPSPVFTELANFRSKLLASLRAFGLR